MEIKNKKGMGFIGIGLLVLGVIALYFIYTTGLALEFINFIKGGFN